MIKDDLGKKITDALKEKDEVRVMTLRMLSSALTNAEIEKKREKLTPEEEFVVVKKEAKKRKDAIEAYEAAGAKERAEKEKKELSILEAFLPEEMLDEKLEGLVMEAIKEIGATGLQDMGKVMGAVMGKVKGEAAGDRVLAVVKEKLGND